MASSDVFDNFNLEEDSPPRLQRSHKKTWQELRNVVRETRRTATRLSPSIPSNFEFRDYNDDAGNPVTRLYFLGSTDKGRDSTLLRADLKAGAEITLTLSVAPLKTFLKKPGSTGPVRHYTIFQSKANDEVQGYESMMSTTPDHHHHHHHHPAQSHTQPQSQPLSALQHRLPDSNTTTTTASSSRVRGGSNLLSIEPVFSSQPSAASSSSSASAMSKEEILMRERKRLMSYGITSYDFDHEDRVFVIPSNNSLFVCTDDIDSPCVPLELPTQTYGARLDPKICPCNSDLVAFVHESDIWLSVRSSGKEYRLTHSHRGCVGMEDDPLSAGAPSFVIQEEFDRYTGYWWSPKFNRLSDGSCIYQLLYEEVDESDVDVLSIFSPTGSESTTDNIRYPRAGGNNAISNLKMVEISLNYNSNVAGDAAPKITFRECAMADTLFSLVPWAQYMTRAGWTSDGMYIYATLLNRLQNRQALVLISPNDFFPESNTPLATPPLPTLHWIYQETSNVWINVHDCLHFFPQTSQDRISFLYASEKSGFRHLYHITSSLLPVQTDSNMEHTGDWQVDEDMFPESAVLEQRAVTQGAWVVLHKELWVDESRGLVFFMGLKDTPLESHLYATRYDQSGNPIVRLTSPGYSHIVQLSKDCTKFVTVFSSLECPPQCKVFSIQHNPQSVLGCACIGTLSPPVDTLGYIPPTPFQYLSQAGHMAYGLYFRPHGLEEGRRYPTVLFVYGGPQVQMVTNSFKGQKFLRLHALAAEGYMVVVIDGRGSTNRGLHFEGCLKNKLGTVEINDQIEGLLWLTSKTNYIDLSRVAIHGWSYGGYLALMGLTQRRDIFKVAIAGAPVVDWELYDTGYTERYLGLPHHNPDAYKNGNVLSYIDLIPESDTRLLLIHGLIDENVHFNHSSVLINRMVSAFKPMQLQVYPNERHGIRSHDAIEHYKTTVLKFLQDYL